MLPPSRIVHLHTDEVSLVVAQVGTLLPVIAHWGERLHASEEDLSTLLTADEMIGFAEDSDVPYRPSLLPEHSRGWFGRPGISAHRAGAAWAPRLVVTHFDVAGQAVDGVVERPGAATIVVRAADPWAQIEVMVEIDLSRAGLLALRTTIANTSDAPEPLQVDEVMLALPLPTRAREALDFSGRWGHERVPQRHAIVHGTHARPSRRGRTGLDATTVMAVGTPGFDSRSGEVWVCHVGFSGDHEHALERGDGTLLFRGGELLLPGEIRLAPDAEYTSPWIFASYGVGLDAAAARFHDHLRSRSRSSRRPRPVTLNVWEAVYFDQDAETLRELARLGAELGAERFVLDDGWFRGRIDDRAGLGDWTPDPVRWPDGLLPLADHVRALGMEFGLWVEPEMINEDSDLAREHPDWILSAGPDLPMRYRFQQVLDLTNPEAFAHILQALDTIVRDTGAAYLKWDHNRDLVAAGHPATDAPAVHDQTLAVYALLDELRARHPQLEIESCASGGGRVDLGILARTDRVHPSDNHDPLDRAGVLRWTGMLVPPEMMGSHVASAISSVTGRSSSLHYRCAVAFLGHFGIEWDIRGLTGAEVAAVRGWVDLWIRHRELIQTGRVVTDDGPAALRGVVARDGAEAVYTILTPATSAESLTRVRLAGLEPERRYRLTVTAPESLGPPWQVPAWLRAAEAGSGGDPIELSGSALSSAGLAFPLFHPERAVLVHAEAVA